jgi:C2 domain
VAGALATPENDKEYQVSLRIADKEWNSGLPTLKKPKFNRFNVKPTETDGEFSAPYYNIQDIGTVILYLKYKGKIGAEKRISFLRLNIMDFLNPNPELKWLELEPDLAIGEVKDHFRAGIVGIKLSIHDIENDGPINWLDFPQWSKRIPKRPPNIKVRVFCWQARDLPAADDTGSSDPFIQITDCDRSQKTQVIWDNVNPLFYEGLDAIYEANSQEELPPVIIDLYDKDEAAIGADSEDFLSRALIYINQITFATDDTIPVPIWHKLYYKKGGAVSGEVLLSFAIVADDYPFKRTLERLRLEREVEMKEFNI